MSDSGSIAIRFFSANGGHYPPACGSLKWPILDQNKRVNFWRTSLRTLGTPTMSVNPSVLLSGFADEAAIDKTATEQFSAFAALGLQYYSIRFIDVGNGVKNVMKLNKTETKTVLKMQDEYGLSVSSIGSPIGKVKLLNVDDGTKNAYIPFKKYLKQDVQHACEVAQTFGAKLIRGFSFYHPKGEDPKKHIPQVVDHLGEPIHGAGVFAGTGGRRGRIPQQ